MRALLGTRDPSAEENPEDEALPDCWGSASPANRNGYGVCNPTQQQPRATRLARLGDDGMTGDGVGPDDPTRYTPIHVLKATQLKKLQEAKASEGEGGGHLPADPIAAYEKWLRDNVKDYTADSELGKMVFTEFLRVIDMGIKHNSDPDALYAPPSPKPKPPSPKPPRPRPQPPPRNPNATFSEFGGPRSEPTTSMLMGFGTGSSFGGASTCSTPRVDNRGGLRPARDQGLCGSCWAFAAAALVEAQNYQSGQPVIPYLSVQQMVDCVITPAGFVGLENKGCDGGYGALALDYIKSKGLVADGDYPYEMYMVPEGTVPPRHTCRSSNFPRSRRTFITDYQQLPPFEDKMLDEMCLRGAKALLVRINVCDSWINYGGGILTTDCDHDWAGHVVTIVGYGTQSPTSPVDYWLIRNSKGANWGDPLAPGHIRVKRGVRLLKLHEYPFRVFTPFQRGGDSAPPPSSIDCSRSALWADGRTRGIKTTEYGLHWAVAVSSTACNKYAYAYNYEDRTAATQAAVSACASYHGTLCRTVAAEKNECADPAAIASLDTWVQGEAGADHYYAVATDWACGHAYGRWGPDAAWVNDVVQDCANFTKSEDSLVTADMPCGLVVTGRKMTSQPSKCTNALSWASTKVEAILTTQWGYSWAIVMDYNCGNQWYTYNWGTVAEAEAASAALDGCNAAAAAAGLGAFACSVVESGTAKCSSPASWQAASQLATGRTAPGTFWGVWMDKTCTISRTATDWGSLQSMLADAQSPRLCNQAAIATGACDSSCGLVDYGTSSGSTYPADP
ncbi:hypothetical protein HYH03_004019 [Edaphochlamys debaryana]|uniref:Peptidase C1A papain C-terminal domain-containing protein n=1 Tax=Edaphochlamys debaryana TaxID=47281 RepID=A0A835Y8L7_9CHLO|nr:hypothetical protein HYH03_004019 [Edaphochlamys debaryana]|eukprot:KAG2498270.1 hypothetical protein HYH03_004019 [Edaphochlamys debaryana]